jgi:hypothetical protein
MLETLGPTLILAMFAYALTGRIEQTLKERQATVASIGSMSELLKELSDKSAKEADLDVLVHRLSMYGADAIGPFITLWLNNQVTPTLSSRGLILIAIRHKDEVCAELPAAIEFAPAVARPLAGASVSLKSRDVAAGQSPATGSSKVSPGEVLEELAVVKGLRGLSETLQCAQKKSWWIH